MNLFKRFKRLVRFIAGSAKLIMIYERSAPLTEMPTETISHDKLQVLVNGLSNSSDLYSIDSDNTSLLHLLAYHFY